MKKVFITTGILVALVAGWFIISRTGDHQNMSPVDKVATERAPDFRLQDYNSKTVSLADFTGKPLVINSWAAWCPFCKEELKDFVAAQEEFGTHVVIVAIDRAESLKVAKNYSDDLGVSEDLVFLLDPSDSFYQAIGGFSMPETIFIDKTGKVLDHKRGPMKLPEIRERIQKIL